MKPTAPSSALQNRLICLVCRQQFSQYTCPRCNLRYCSLPCYKTHSARCVESFNRDNVLQEMQDLSATPETRQRMMETLKRFYSESCESRGDEDVGSDLEDEDEDDGASSVLSETTLKRIASGEQIDLNDLLPMEKRAFFRAVASGEFSHMIKPWEPWWRNPSSKNVLLNKQGNRLVQQLDSLDRSLPKDDNDSSDVPAPIDSPLPSLKQLTPVQPSPLLGVHLTEVLYSYCFTLRLYNGDWLCDACDSAFTVLSLSQVLGQGNSPETVFEALNGCFETICSPLFKSSGGYNFALALLDDAAALLCLGRAGVICSLSDLHRMFNAAANEFKQDSGHTAIKKPMPSSELMQFRGRINSIKANRRKTLSNSVNISSKKQVIGACRKIYFLLCWANEQLDDTFSSLALLVEAEKAKLIDVDTVDGHQKQRGNDSCVRKPMLEEIC